MMSSMRSWFGRRRTAISPHQGRSPEPLLGGAALVSSPGKAGHDVGGTMPPPTGDAPYPIARRMLEDVTPHLSKARHPEMRALHAYWEAIRGTRRIPRRSDLSPGDIGPLLPHVFLIDVTRDPRDFRFRLVGTRISETTGQQMTGKMMSEVFPPEFYRDVHHHWSLTVDEQRPRLGIGTLWVSDKEWMPWEGLIMPLSHRSDEADMLLGGLAFGQPSG
jgi:hypothetical protein